jgi:hypothetical protein
MEDRKTYREKMEKELDQCSSRLKELKGKAKSDEVMDELEELEGEVKSCRLELQEIEHRSDDKWIEAKHGLMTRLDSMRRNMRLASRKII